MQHIRVVYHGISHGSLVFSFFTEKIQVTCNWKFHGIPGDQRALHNYFITCHRKYSGLHNQCDLRAAHDRNVRSNTVEYTTAFLCFDWLNSMAWYKYFYYQLSYTVRIPIFWLADLYHVILAGVVTKQPPWRHSRGANSTHHCYQLHHGFGWLKVWRFFWQCFQFE